MLRVSHSPCHEAKMVGGRIKKGKKRASKKDEKEKLGDLCLMAEKQTTKGLEDEEK